MSEQDVDKLKRFVKAIDDIVEVGEDVFADGKVSFEDAAHALRLSAPMKELYELWGSKEEMFAEAKNLSWDEVKELADAAKN